MLMSGGSLRASVPFGPFTVTSSPARVTSTPEGTGMGLFPIRDIRSPHETEDLAADPALARLAIGHEALAGRENGHAEAAQHTRQAVGLGVDAQPGLGDASDPGDRPRPLGRVLHLDL